MELEKGKNLPHVDPLDLEEGELREDAATIPTTDAAEMEVEANHDRPADDDAKSSSSSEKRRGKRRSDNGEHGHHAKKRSKKDKPSKKGNDGKRHRTADGDNGNDDDDEGTTSHKQQQQHDGEGAADGEGDRRKRKGEHRSSANHHRDDHHSRHHRDHHRDHHHHPRSSGGGSAGKHDERSSPDDSRPRASESQERRSRSDRERERERERSRHSASRERERERERERDGRRDGGGGGDRGSRSSSRSRDDRHRERRVADEGRESRYERDDRRTRYDERDHRGAGGADRRYERGGGGGREGEYGRGYERNGSGVGGREGEYRRGYERDGADERRGGGAGGDDRGRAPSRDETDRKQEQEQQEKKAKQREEEEYAKMVEEELRRKEKEQSEEEKAQKLIEERRKRRQAILDKYKQDKATTAGSDQPAAATTEEVQQPVVTSADVATAPAADEANEKEKEEEKSEKQEAQPDVVEEEEPKKVVTHFDMFNELPAALIPSDQKLGRPLGAAAATGEDELNLADNWDDEEGYYAFRIGEVINKRYTVNASHGKGVFSTVLIAKDAQNNDVDVAIKVIRNNDTMFRAGVKEKELLEKITAADPKDKKHCIRVLDSFQYRNHLCLVLEPMSMNLREVVKKFGRDVGITMQAVRTYARQLFLALKHLKSLNMLHADLKPDNIVLNANLTVLKLCDFGSASLMEEENAITPYLVSRFYRAPEIMLGLPYDFGIDMWAAGCCLFEMYTGKILYPGRSNNEMLRMQMDAMGPFPRKMLRKSKFWQRHFHTQTFYFQQICIDEVSQQEYVKEVNVVKPVRDLKAELQRAATAEDVGHAGQLADLMLKCLCLDPAKRISPEVALAHPFLKP